VWEVRDGRFEEYEGDWEFYQRKRASRQAAGGRTGGGQTSQSSASTGTSAGTASTGDLASAQAAVTSAAGPAPAVPGGNLVAGLTRWQMQKRLAEVELEITTLEGELERVTAGLAAPASAITPALLAGLAITTS